MRKAYDPQSPLLCSHLAADDRISDHKMRSFCEAQLSLFDGLIPR